jgi:hypothetical protein
MTAKTREISNTDDVIDSRDVIARIEEIEGLGDDKNLSQEDLDEVTALRALQDRAEGYASDWQYGATLIRRSYFKQYAMQLADDIGAINADATWPNNCIDWDRAARELEMDYTLVDFGDVEYLVRS